MNSITTQLPDCPVCHGSLAVASLHCGRCDVTVSGHFARGRFDGLAPDQLLFLETFLRCRGVIRDVEGALGISYPTVRARLDSLLAALGLDAPEPVPVSAEETAVRRHAVLRQIDSGQLTPEEGLRILESLK